MQYHSFFDGDLEWCEQTQTNSNHRIKKEVRKDDRHRRKKSYIGVKIALPIKNWTELDIFSV